MTHDGLSDATEVMNSNAHVLTDIMALAAALGWSLRDVAAEGLDTSQLNECPVCATLYIAGAFKGHCSDDCKQKALWRERQRREQRQTACARGMRVQRF